LKIPVEDRTLSNQQSEDAEDMTYCEICGRCDREDRLLLCDGCDLGYHCECLVPPVADIPYESWYCPECADEETVYESDDNGVAMETVSVQNVLATRLRQNSVTYRTIARTRFSERVRRRINNTRLQRGATIIVSESDESLFTDGSTTETDTELGDIFENSEIESIGTEQIKASTSKTKKSKQRATAKPKSKRAKSKRRVFKKVASKKRRQVTKPKSRRMKRKQYVKKRRISKNGSNTTKIKLTRPQERIVDALRSKQPLQSETERNRRACATIPTFNLFSSAFDNEVEE
jgi:PHD and RING finger domain-containing protein 1